MINFTKFIMARDINGTNGFGLMPSYWSYTTTLVANVEQTITVPSSNDPMYQRMLIIFGIAPGSTIWVAYNNTATVPSGSFAQSNSEMNPTARWVKAEDVIHLITNDASDEVGVIFYSF